MSWDPRRPHNELPPLPPAVEVETKRVLKLAVEARASVAALDQATRRIPNPTVLLNAIPLLEAQASSEIENIVTTADELFAAAAAERSVSTPETKETLRYRAALMFGVDSVRSRPLSINTVTAICSLVQSRTMRVRDLPGTFVGNPRTHEAIYTPPTGRDAILEKLDAWQRFINLERSMDPIVVMALGHYQFEAIHPFADGNGRTGRIVAILQLIQSGLLHEPVLYLSRYIIRRKDEYYRLLQGVTEHEAWEDWVAFILEGVQSTADSTVAKIDAIQVLQRDMHESLRALIPGGANADLLDVLFEQPYCRIAGVMERCSVSRPTATKWLNALVDGGVLSDVRAGKQRIFINDSFFSLLTGPESPSSSDASRLF